MGNYTKKNIDFSRQAMLGKSTRPGPIIALYPRNTGNTKIEINIATNATVLSIRYTSTTVTTVNITYANKSVEDVVQEINQTTIPIKAIALSETDILRQGDLISTGPSYVTIPSSFGVYDRLEGNGVLLRSKKVSVRHKETSNIKVLPPYRDETVLPWYPRILNGSFSQKYNNKLYHFYIPEYDNQSWSTFYGKPFKEIIGAKPVALDRNIYKLPRSPIYWNGQNITLYNNDVPLSNSIIQDIDINNGILYLDPQVFLEDNFSIDYVYLENSYVYKDINLNGHFSQNPIILDKFVVIYMLPVEASTAANKRTIYHVVGDSIESAIDSIEIEDPSIPFAIIGAYNVQPIFYSDKINILDTRSKGGGLRKSSGPTSPVHLIDNPILPDAVEIEQSYTESYRFWDIGNIDGEPYPAAAAVTMELPSELKDLLDISDIKKKASKFIAAGVYPSIEFYNRELPSVTGLSRQVSSTYNLDLQEIFTKSITGVGVASSIPNTFTGAGWVKINTELPGSILTADWTNYFPTFLVKNIDNKVVAEVSEGEGIGFTYLKGSPDAGISWYERTVTYNSGFSDIPIEYSSWEKKTHIDTKEVFSGQLSKNYFYIKPENNIKQYRDFTCNSPYHPKDLKGKVRSSISNIIDNILEFQTTGYNQEQTQEFNTSLKEVYGDLADRSILRSVGNYTLTPKEYVPLFNLKGTDLEEDYKETIHNIGEDLIKYGTYLSGHYFKFFLQPNRTYYSIVDGGQATLLSFNDGLKVLNKYLDFRQRTNSWSGYCITGEIVSTGLVSRLMSSESLFADFDPGIPTYWVYFPTNTASGINNDYISGYYITKITDLGSTYSEVSVERNYDYLYTDSLPAIASCILSNTGTTIVNSSTLSSINRAYSLAVDNLVSRVDEAVNGVRFYSGLPTTSHWFVGHNRLGTYLGRNLSNLIETHEYLYDYNTKRNSIYDIRYPSAAGPSFLNYIFSGIEKILDTSYDVVYNNLLRAGVTEPEVANTIAAYGWYINNWSNNYGTVGKTFSYDKRDKYYTLFKNGLSQLLKNQFTEEGQLLEVKSVLGEPGAFQAITPVEILNPISEALKIDKTYWEGLAEGTVQTILDTYFSDGLYYSDPYLQNSAAGRELDLADGLTKIYKSLSITGKDYLFEPIFTGFSNVRGAKFYPNFNSYNNNLPTGDWQGNVNTLSMWKYYNSGDVEKAVGNLKSIGINTLVVDLDYILWKVNSGLFYNKLDHLFNTCVDNRISLIPNFFNEEGTVVSEANYTDYVNSFGHTGGMYRADATDYMYFTTGTFSGSSYVLDTVARYDYSPSLIAWSIVSNPVANGVNIMNYNSIAYLIDTNSTSLIMYNLGLTPSIGDVVGLGSAASDQTEGLDPKTLKYNISDVVYTGDTYNRFGPVSNPRIDIIGVSPNPIFDYLIDKLPTSSRTYTLYDYGNSSYGDYSLAIRRAYQRKLPIILSDIYVKSGSSEGIIYDDLECRISRHATSIKELAAIQRVDSTGIPVQVSDFSNKYFYPSEYAPSYNGFNLIYDIRNWGIRNIKNPLSSYNTGMFKQHLSSIRQIQSGLDTLNDLYYTELYRSDFLTNQEKQDLNYYRSTWDSADFISNISNAWLLSGQIDSNRYDMFIDEWGNTLRNICWRLDING